MYIFFPACACTQTHSFRDTGKEKALTSYLTTSGLFHPEMLVARMLKSSPRLVTEKDALKPRVLQASAHLWLVTVDTHPQMSLAQASPKPEGLFKVAR